MKLVWMFIGSVSLFPGDLDEALTLYRQEAFGPAEQLIKKVLREDGENVAALILLARVYNAGADYKKAQPLTERLVKMRPDDWETQFVRAVALRHEMANAGMFRAMFVLKEYKKVLEKAKRLNPKAVDTFEEEVGYYTYAPSIAGGGSEAARKKLPYLKKLDWRRGSRFEAIINQREGQREEATKIWQEMIDKDPSDDEALLRLGRLVLANDPKKADTYFAKSVNATRLSIAWDSRYSMAEARIKGKFELEEAVKLLGDFLKERPDYLVDPPTKVDAHWMLGNAYKELGQKPEARAHYKKALTLNPRFSKAKKSLKSL